MPDYKPAFVFPFAVNGLITVMSILMLLYGRKIPLGLRLTISYVVVGWLMVLLPLAAEYFSDPDKVGYTLCIVILLIYSVFSGTLQSSTFGMGAFMPFKFMGAITFGNGFGGILSCILNSICLIVFPDDLFVASMWYFCIAAVVMLICAVFVAIMMKNVYFRYYFDKSNKAFEEKQN